MEREETASSGPEHVTELTRRLAAGEEEAFAEFHAEYFDRLYRFMLVITRGQEDQSQEALQQTLLRVLRYIRVFKSEEVFWSWLKAVARSAARDANRKQHRYYALLERFGSCFCPSAPNSFPHEEDRLAEVLQESLAELQPLERRLLEAKYIEGSTVRELCDQTGLTPKAIESRLARLRQVVRARILKRLAAL